MASARKKDTRLTRRGDDAYGNECVFEFHISKKCRDFYAFSDKLFSLTGNVILANIPAVKTFVLKVNEKKKSGLLAPSQVNAMGLIDEILHFVLEQYRKQKNANALSDALAFINDRCGKKAVTSAVKKFVELFPPAAVYAKEQTAASYLRQKHNVHATIAELLALRLANTNPAFASFREFFNDDDLNGTAYFKIFDGLHEFFKTQPPYGPYNQHIIDMLRAPAEASPHSLEGQLLYIKEHWGMILSPEMRERLTRRILLSLDFIREETKVREGAAGAAKPLEFQTHDGDHGDRFRDEERFSADTDWMPVVVMIAKQTNVWLSQLSKKYSRPVTKLDEIPDDELNILAEWGINALWLIGIWERSKPSQKIKNKCGNPEALASAYSVYDYEIAWDLGGENAFNNLKERARSRGIRIAVDMVPNHTGIFSRWILDHPDWFIQSNNPPFPRYAFTGPDLSDDPGISTYIEDGYWNRTDAAVVFKLQDNNTGKVRYIYHGNDGTSTPWNDTAQLNFLLPAVREAVIQKIVQVAKRSPLIRLDAAMTLTKQHYQRLWFPEPGTGGDIPSRTVHSMTKGQFNRFFPKEFWREVVDRIQNEAPDTLLLAEAFWLLEGYFVRNLGMHRVYNSAFMNMLKREDNANFRVTIKNVLDFNPEILRRFVNFMSNPDEMPAIEQFGTGDKYFGIAMMMATLPGLVMFGHGQIDGLGEKYGMEYRKAYWDEAPDQSLIERHRREIFPLLKKRRLFSGVDNFFLYDFYDSSGAVIEDVFAYSNSTGREQALVVYNNKYQNVKGWIKNSVNHKSGGASVRKILTQALGLRPDDDHYYSFRDRASNLEYVRSGKDLAQTGLYVELGAYQYHLFMDFKEIHDPTGDHAKLCAVLNGRGVDSIVQALRHMKLEPVTAPFRQLVNKETLVAMEAADDKLPLIEKMYKVTTAIKKFTDSPGSESTVIGDFTLLWRVIKDRLEPTIESRQPLSSYVVPSRVTRHAILYLWLITRGLGKLKTGTGFEQQSILFFDNLLLGDVIFYVLKDFGQDQPAAERHIRLIKTLISTERITDELTAANLSALMNDRLVQQYISVHEHGGITWFHKESFEELMQWLFLVAAVKALAQSADDPASASVRIERDHALLSTLLASSIRSEYRWNDLLRSMPAVKTNS
ncbi:MAG TPA: alpha-amylase family glycosyl hydrolase [bacterium]